MLRPRPTSWTLLPRKAATVESGLLTGKYAADVILSSVATAGAGAAPWPKLAAAEVMMAPLPWLMVLDSLLKIVPRPK